MTSIGELAASIRCALYRAEPKMPSYPVGVIEPYLTAALDESRAETERQIVEWLRAEDAARPGDNWLGWVAGRIEKGEHRG